MTLFIPGSEIRQMISYLLNHKRPHLARPYRLGRVILAQEGGGELVRPVVVQIGHHGLWKQLAEDAALH